MPTTDIQRTFTEHYRTYRDKIYTFFWYRVNGDRALAEDLTADVFVKALRHLDRYDPARPFGPWIYAIAWNHLKNHYRAPAREMALDEAVDLPAKTADPAAALEHERLLAAIGTLDDYSRDVLLGRYVDELSHREIAQVLDRTEEAVRAQASRAMKELRKRLQQ